MPKRRLLSPEEPGPLDFPLSPAMGSCGPFAPASARMMALSFMAVLMIPLLCPADLVLLACQGGALWIAFHLCESGHDRAHPCLIGGVRDLQFLPPHVPFPLEGHVARALAPGWVPAPTGGSPDASLLVDGHEYPVKDLALIGRSEDCHVCVDDPTLALYQAALVPCGGRISIINLQAAELTVNGNRLSEGQLEPGDVIRLGRTTMVYYRDQVLVPAEPEPRVSGPPVARLEWPGGALTLHRSWYYWIGRNPTRCDLVIADPGAADRHALIAVGASGTVTLVDFTSPLGTRVNQRRSHFRTLVDGDVLTIGQTPVSFCERI